MLLRVVILESKGEDLLNKNTLSKAGVMQQ